MTPTIFTASQSNSLFEHDMSNLSNDIWDMSKWHVKCHEQLTNMTLHDIYDTSNFVFVRFFTILPNMIDNWHLWHVRHELLWHWHFTSLGGRDDAEGAKLLVGHVDGTVTIIELGLEGNKYPFGDGKRKLRGVINHIDLSRQRHKIRSYRGHCDPVREIQFLKSSSRGRNSRKLILSTSRDPKFSLFCEDYSGICESFIISLPKVVRNFWKNWSVPIFG